jgi:hypothetical protein
VTKWSLEDDHLLAHLVTECNADWSAIASRFPGRTSKQVLAHWRKVADPEIVRGSWTAEEDKTIINWIELNGPSKWAALATHLPGRIPKQCRERWVNHLDPSIKKVAWSPEEDEVILSGIQQIGMRWADLSRLLPGRSDNAIKNRWNSALKRRSIPQLTLQIDQIVDQPGFVPPFSVDQIQALLAAHSEAAAAAINERENSRGEEPPLPPN